MSYMSRLAWAFLGLWLLCLAPAYGQEKKPPEKPWTGRLADGREITRADLDQIIQAHKLWLERDGTKWKRADLSFAKLSGAWLDRANLSGANLGSANLSGANLSSANLSDAKLGYANLIGAKLFQANLSGAKLFAANLSGAELGGSNLSGAVLTVANLSGAKLLDANLSEAWLDSANLSGAWLNRADLSGVRFEPDPGSLPGVKGLLYLKGLDSLWFKGGSSFSLMELREIFKKAGMRDEERQLTYALNHNRRDNAWNETKIKAKSIGWLTVEIARLENIFQLVFFEWTCDWGMSPGWPLELMVIGIFLFTLPYLLFLWNLNPRNGIWLTLLPERVLDRHIKDRPIKLTFRTPLRPLPVKKWARFAALCRRALRAIRLAFYFSLLSAFNIGWREINVGSWITRIQKREYTLRGTGWVRMISGIQALLSVYLLALWALTYFGRPFE